jgi:DNA-binding MarR family transcriptional regulator
MADNERPVDEAWHLLARYVIDNRDAWRRAAMSRTGLPFSKIRIIRRLSLADGPMSLSQVADAASMDRPAATVAINDLADRGLVRREVDPADRRSRMVSLTAAGRAMMATISSIEDPAPDELAGLPDRDIEVLLRIARQLDESMRRRPDPATRRSDPSPTRPRGR